MTRAQALVTEKQFAEAVALLEKTQRPSGSHGMTWTLLKAEAAAGAGHVNQAYATLLDIAAAVPDARVEAALAKYGREFSKSPRDVDADLWRVRDAKATIAAPFELASSRGGVPVKLADYAASSCCWRFGSLVERAAVRSFLTCSRSSRGNKAAA